MIDSILEYNRKFVESKAYEPFITDKYPEKKLAVLNLQYTELLEKHKKASISPETEKLLTTEQAKNAAFMKLIKEQNDELANIKKQYNELVTILNRAGFGIPLER